MREIFGLKTQKTGPGLAMIAIPKPVYSGFTVFWAVFALKARKLPDLSGRQIRQLLCDNSTKRNIEKGVCSKRTYYISALTIYQLVVCTPALVNELLFIMLASISVPIFSIIAIRVSGSAVPLTIPRPSTLISNE